MLDPQAKAVLDVLAARAKPMPADEGEWLAGYREEQAGITEMQGAPPVVAVVSRCVESSSGSIDFRLYRPSAALDGGARARPAPPTHRDLWSPDPRLTSPQPNDGTSLWPTLVFIHGGGFVAGSLDGYDIPLRHLALRSGWQIAAVECRSAPGACLPCRAGRLLRPAEALRT